LKKIGLKNSATVFQDFLGLVTANLDVLFAEVYLPPKGGSGFNFADGLDDPFQTRLEIALG
jgi:hypothetical protein